MYLEKYNRYKLSGETKMLERVQEGEGRIVRHRRDVRELPFTEDNIFEVLSNRRRRYAIQYLKGVDDVATLRDLAEQVAAWEYDRPVWALDASERKTVKNALHQFHLPKMAEFGVVEYDARRGLVELTDAADEVDVYVEVVPKRDVPWGPYYLLFTLLHAPLVLGRWYGVEPLTELPWVAFIVYFMVAVGASAALHTFDSYSSMRLGASVDDADAEVREYDE